MNKKGISLIELLAAVVLVIIVVATMSYFLPKAMTAASSSRYITTAKNLAAGDIQILKQQPYDNIIPTNATGAIFVNSGIGVSGCDCSKETVSTIPSPQSPSPLPAQTTDGSVTFTHHVCINLVNRLTGAATWTSYCSDGTSTTDKGLKNIHVWVTWQLNTLGVQQGSLVKGGTFGVATEQQSVDMESVVIRQ